MNSFLEKIGKIDRKIIFLVIGLSVLIPLMKPNWVKLPLKIDANTKTVFNSLQNLEENDRVLISIAYGASTKPEVHPMVIALLKHLFSKGIKVYIVSLWPEGPIMAQQAMKEVIDSDLFDIQDGINYVMFDYKAGGMVVIKNIADDFTGVYKQDFNKKPVSEIPAMDGVYNVNDFNFVFDFSAGVPGNAEWVQYACDPKDVPLSSGCTSIMVTDAIPYVKSGQLKGIIAGMPGAAEYEQLVYELLIKNQLTNKYIIDDADILKGKAFSRMSAQSIAHLIMVLLIVLGNLSYYYSRKRI